METFTFIEKNGSGTLTLSADNLSEALDTLEEIVLFPEDWRFDS